MQVDKRRFVSTFFCRLCFDDFIAESAPKCMQHLSSLSRNAAAASIVALYFCIPWTLAGANITLLCMAVAWVLEGRWRKRWQIAADNAVTPALVALYGLLLLGALYTTAPWADVADHLMKYHKLLLMVVALSLLSDPVVRGRCWTAFTIAMLLTLLSSYLNIWFTLPWSKSQNLGWGADHSVFKDYITQGALMTLLMLRALYLALSGAPARNRWFWAAIALLAFVCNTQLSWGRTGYLSTGVAVLVFFLALTPARRWLHVLLLLGVALFLVVWLSPTIIQRVALAVHEIGQQPDSATSIGQRLFTWQRSLDLFWVHPFLGWGTGAYHGEYCRLVASQAWCAAGSFHPHNQFLFFMVEYGLIGLVCFMALLGAAAWQAWHLAPRDRAVAMAFLGVVCVGNMTHSGFWLSNEGLAYGFGLVLVLSAARRGPLTNEEAGA